MEWIIAGFLALVIIVFLILRNKKDKKKFLNQLNRDYHIFKKEESDSDADEITG